MAYYEVRFADDDTADSCWVEAHSAREARKLVALNVPGFEEAEDPKMFVCAPSTQKTPPAGLIHRRLHAPVPITKR